MSSFQKCCTWNFFLSLQVCDLFSSKRLFPLNHKMKRKAGEKKSVMFFEEVKAVCKIQQV